MRLKRHLGAAALLAVGIVMLAMSGPAVFAAPPTCATNGYKTGAVTCAGTCPDNSPCPPAPAGVGNGPLGQYQFCACPDEGESNCCHLIKLMSEPYTGLIVPNGNCNASGCPTTPPLCRRMGEGTLLEPYTAACVN